MGLDALSVVGPTGVQLLDFCCSSVSVSVLLLSTHLVSSQCWIFIYMFAVLMHRWVRSPSREPNNFYVNELKQNLGRGLCARKSGLSAPPPPPAPAPVIYYWPFQGGAAFVVYSNCHCSSAFCLSMTFLQGFNSDTMWVNSLWKQSQILYESNTDSLCILFCST